MYTIIFIAIIYMLIYNNLMDNDIRISISEASRLFGVSVKTIRQAIRNEELRYIIVNGRYKLNFQSVVSWSQLSTRRRNLLAKMGIGQYVDKWNIHNKKYSPRIPEADGTATLDAVDNSSENITYIPAENTDSPKD